MKNKTKEPIEKIINERIKKYKEFVPKSIIKDSDRRGEAFQLYVVKVIKNIDHNYISDEQRIDKSGREYLIDFFFSNKNFSKIDILCVQTGNYTQRILSDLKDGIIKLLLEHKKLDNKKLESKRKKFWKNKSSIEYINIFCCTINRSKEIREYLDDLALILNKKIKSNYPKTKINIFLLDGTQLLTYEKKLLSKEIGKYELKLKGGQEGLIQNIFDKSEIKSVNIALVKTKDLLKIYREKGDLIFYLNIRNDLGLNEVNKSILKDASSDYFWCLNNGLAIVCDSFDRKASSDVYSIINPVVINGQQTLRTLSKEPIKKNHYILCKIIVTSDIDFIEKITETTNSQTHIEYRDLKSNHPLLISLEELFKMNNLTLKRKKEKRTRFQPFTYTSKTVAQSVMSTLKYKPNIGRLGKDKILFDKYFEDIFLSDDKKIILSILIYDNVNRCVKLILKKSKSEISKFVWHITCRIWKKELMKKREPNLDKIIVKYKKMSLSNSIIKKEYQFLYKRIPKNIIKNKQVGSYLNKDESLQIIR